MWALMRSAIVRSITFPKVGSREIGLYALVVEGSLPSFSRRESIEILQVSGKVCCCRHAVARDAMRVGCVKFTCLR